MLAADRGAHGPGRRQSHHGVSSRPPAAGFDAGRPEPDAVFAKHPAIVFGRGAARGNLEFAQRNAFGGVLGRKEHAKRLSQDLFGGVAEDDFRTRQPGRDATFRVQKKERVLAGIGKKYVK
jgi:hypothetical protein